MLLFSAWCALAYAHKASDAYLDLRPVAGAIVVRWDIALRDLDQLLDLDRNGNGSLEWGEIERRQPAIRDYALKAIDLATPAGPCPPASVTQQLARRSDGAYAVLRWRADCPQASSRVDIGYRLLMGIDPTHRAILSVPGAEVSLRTLRPSTDAQSVDLRGDRAQREGERSPVKSGGESYDLAGFFIEGFRHILYGVDHLAFLIALLIPAIATAAVGDRRLASTLGELVTVISVFTLAHSITLGLTALNLIDLPSGLVESVVALSVAVAGLQSLWVLRFAGTNGATGSERLGRGMAALPTWLVFAFGLVHGIGFGSALGSAGFGGRPVLSALFGFNVGVEAGQLAALAVIFPLAWALRDSFGFRPLALPAIASTIVLAGVAWFLLRAFGIDVVPQFLPQ